MMGRANVEGVIEETKPKQTNKHTKNKHGSPDNSGVDPPQTFSDQPADMNWLEQSHDRLGGALKLGSCATIVVIVTVHLF